MPNPLLSQALPTIMELTVALSDGKLDAEERARLIPKVLALVAALVTQAAEPHPAPAPVVPTPPPVVSQPPAPVTPTPGAVVDVAEIHGRIKDVWQPSRVVGGRRGVPEDPARVAEVNRIGSTSNFARGQFVCLDWTFVMDDDSILTEDDPRWVTVNAGWSRREDALHGNEAVLFTGYEVNGAKTDGPNGEPGGGTHNPNVEPQSVVSDGPGRPYGMTPVYEVDLTGGARVRFTGVYKRHDGRKVFGIVGRGNKNGPDAEPFTFEG